ncbi:SMAD/FHA domain-containing protein, partial [Phlyctochytrium arcticum]
KEQPNFGASGALAAEQNTFKGVVLKYSEPPEARKPKERFRLYVFKGKDQIDVLHIHRQSAFLIGRDRLVADIPVDHPSCSKQHAALQFRQKVETDAIGQSTRTVKPYIIDLDATNGSYINGDRIPPSRYVELKVGDSIKFGFSTREYVLMSESLVDDAKEEE